MCSGKLVMWLQCCTQSEVSQNVAYRAPVEDPSNMHTYGVMRWEVNMLSVLGIPVLENTKVTKFPFRFLIDMKFISKILKILHRDPYHFAVLAFDFSI